MGATAFNESNAMDQLCDALLSKLAERIEGRLPSKQRVAGSNPAWDATKLVHLIC